jgi:Helix-turn-helix domain
VHQPAAPGTHRGPPADRSGSLHEAPAQHAWARGPNARRCSVTAVAKSGRCFPSYETIAAKADCGEDTVARAIVALEQVGLLSWCNRLARVAIKGMVKVIRTSNSYWFNDPGSKYEFKSGTRFTVNQERKQDGASRAEVVSRKERGDIQPEIPCEEVG